MSSSSDSTSTPPSSSSESVSVSSTVTDDEDTSQRSRGKTTKSVGSSDSRNIDDLISGRTTGNRPQKKDKSLSQIIGGRPSYSGYEPDVPVMPKISSPTQEKGGIWSPPKMDFTAAISPVAEFDDDDDSLSLEISYEGESAELDKLAAIAKGEMNQFLPDDDDDDDDESVIEEKEEVIEEEEEVIEEEGVTETKQSATNNEEKQSKRIDESDSSDDSSYSESLMKPAPVSAPTKTPLQKAPSTTSFISVETVSSGSSSSSDYSHSSSSSSSLFKGSKTAVKMNQEKNVPKPKQVAFEEEDDDSYETDSYETDDDETGDYGDYETDDGTEEVPLKQNPVKQKTADDEASSDSISDQKQQNYNYGNDPEKHRESPKSDRVPFERGQMVSLRARGKAHVDDDGIRVRAADDDGIDDGIRIRAADDDGIEIEEEVEYPDYGIEIEEEVEYPEYGIEIEEEVEYPDESIVEERPRKQGFFNRLFGKGNKVKERHEEPVKPTTSSKQKRPPPSQYRGQTKEEPRSKQRISPQHRSDPRNSRPRNFTEPTLWQEIPPAAPDSSSNAYTPKDYNDEVSEVTDTHFGTERKNKSFPYFYPNSSDILDAVPAYDSRRNRKARHGHSFLPSVSSSHMSVRNVRTALVDLKPLSVRQSSGFPGEQNQDDDDDDDKRNSKAAPANMRPLSIGNYQPGDIPSNEALVNLEPLSVGVSLRNANFEGKKDASYRDGSDNAAYPFGYGYSVSSVPGEVDVEEGKRLIQQQDHVDAGITVEEEIRFPHDDDSDSDSDDSSSISQNVDELLQQAQQKEDKDSSFHLRSFIFGCIFLLFWIGVGVGIWAIFEFLAPEKIEPTSAPTTSTPTSLRDKISPRLPDGGESFDDPTSPQSQALDWLEQNDNLSSYDDGKILQRYALAVFYYSTDGGSWTNNDLWLSDSDECSWYSASTIGPSCIEGKFANLILGENNIGGTLPADLVILSDSLVGLDIGGQISDQIPTEYVTLTKLSVLRIHGGIDGSLPSALFTSLTNLIEMDLGRNNFSGSLPSEISKLTELTGLSLMENNLIGSIPSTIGDMKGLQSLILDSNKFTSMPEQISFLSNLRLLSVRNNALTGTISADLGLLQELRGLYLDNNNLRWRIPPQLGQLTNLEDGLGLSNNSLVGEIPSEFGELTRLSKYFTFLLVAICCWISSNSFFFLSRNPPFEQQCTQRYSACRFG